MKKNNSSQKLDVFIIGSGMIVKDQILPSLYELQRNDAVGKIFVCSRNKKRINNLIKDPELNRAFPKQGFVKIIAEEQSTSESHYYKEYLKNLSPKQAVVVALPDHLHYEAVKSALEHDQNVLCVKPLVLNIKQAKKIIAISERKSLMVCIEYHKRFDRRSLIAKNKYERGLFGKFIIGEAKMIEPYHYRSSNFQKWFTEKNTDPFSYVGCHYIDLVNFITGVRPKEVSVVGVNSKFSNGSAGFVWSCGRIVYENGAILSLINGLGYPDEGAGSNEQCLTMFFEGNNKTGMIKHDDQFRGCSHSYIVDDKLGRKFCFINPDYFQLVPYNKGKGEMQPVGYGFESIKNMLSAIIEVNDRVRNVRGRNRIKMRRDIIRSIEKSSFIAMPKNSFENILIAEAGRMSILNNGKNVSIDCEKGVIKLHK